MTMTSADWAALAAAAQEGGTAYLEAEAAGGGAASPDNSTLSATASDSLDSLGLPETPSAAGSTSPLVPSLPPNATVAQQEAAAMAEYNASPQLQAYIQQAYGYIGAYLLQQPELLPILVTAGLLNWGQSEFDGAVSQTQWYQTTSQAQRNFQEIQATDPGEAAQQISQMQDTILGEAQSLGITVPADQLKKMAQMAVTFNWSSDVIQQTLRAGAGGTQSSVSTSFGATATFADQAQQLAGEFSITLSPAQLQKYVTQNAQGTLTADGLQEQFAQQAEQMYPWMSASIQQGVTPSQYLSSYASAAASTLGIDPSDVNWADPKWNAALLQTVNGQQQPVSVGVFQQNLMKNPQYGYEYTQGARDQAYGTAQTILQTFGKVAGTSS
jgi:hypothetical protein